MNQLQSSGKNPALLFNKYQSLPYQDSLISWLSDIMSTDFISTRTAYQSSDSLSSEKHSTLVQNEIEFLQTNLCEVRIDGEYGYGFLDGTEDRKDEFIEQFTALNSTCFVRSTTDVKERGKERAQKSYENGRNHFFYFCYRY